MITANELRLGNFVKDRGGKVIRIDFLEHIQNGYDTKFGQLIFLEGNEVHPMTEYTDYAEPIQLTEEWLIKLGFVSNPYQDRYEFNSLHIECNKTKGYLELWIEDFPHIKYVHQLQNLCYLMFNQELTINQP
jgi:hypothetical protein